MGGGRATSMKLAAPFVATTFQAVGSPQPMHAISCSTVSVNRIRRPPLLPTHQRNEREHAAATTQGPPHLKVRAISVREDSRPVDDVEPAEPRGSDDKEIVMRQMKAEAHLGELRGRIMAVAIRIVGQGAGLRIVDDVVICACGLRADVEISCETDWPVFVNDLKTELSSAILSSVVEKSTIQSTFSLLLSALLNTKVSCPEAPHSLSLPRPPLITSFPALPSTRSQPLPPLR